MRIFLTTCVIAVLLVIACGARNIELLWDQSGDTTGMVWLLERRQGDCTSTDPFQSIVTVQQQSYTDQNVPYGTLSYQVKARVPDPDNPGQFLVSPPSNCASAIVTPSSPENLRLNLAMAFEQRTDCVAAVPRIWIGAGLDGEKPLGLEPGQTQTGAACDPFSAMVLGEVPRG